MFSEGPPRGLSKRRSSVDDTAAPVSWTGGYPSAAASPSWERKDSQPYGNSSYETSQPYERVASYAESVLPTDGLSQTEYDKKRKRGGVSGTGVVVIGLCPSWSAHSGSGVMRVHRGVRVSAAAAAAAQVYS